MLTITRKLEFDAGHRIPDHHSQCRNLHGHRYVLHITLEGDPLEKDGDSGNGMILDFSEVKKLAETHLVSHWDHAFWFMKKIRRSDSFLTALPNHKTVVLDRVPTGGKYGTGCFRYPEKRL